MKPTLRLLIVEDRAADAELMVLELRKAGYDVAAERVDTMPGVLEGLDRKPDLVLVDYTLPSFTAETVLEEVGRRQLPTPVIIVSGTIREEKGIECMKLGAFDYILKDRVVRLAPAVGQALDRAKKDAASRVLAEELRMAQRVALLGSWRVDLATQRTEWSPQMYDLFRRPPARGPFTREEFKDLVRPQDAMLVDGAIARASAGFPVPPTEMEIRLPDGDMRWFEGRVESVKGPAGGVVAIRGTWQDMTDKKRAETERRALESTLHDLVEGLPDGILRLSPEGWIDYANPAAVAMLGFPNLDRLKAAVGSFTSFCVSADEGHAALQAIRNGTGTPAILELRRQDRSTFWAAFTGTLEHLSDGSSRILATLHDTTAERREYEATQYLAAIVESSEDAVFSMDLDGVLKTWNHSAERTFGFSPAEAVGHHVFDCIVPLDRHDEWRKAMETIRAGASAGRFETVRVRKDGVRLDVSLTLSPVRDASGRVIAASVACHDLTASKKAEQAKLELDHQNREVQRLKELSEMRMQFLNVAAHDLNTPLTPVMLQLATLRNSKDLSPAHLKSLEMLERNAQRFRVLVQDMLDSARLQGGRLKLNLGAVELAPLVHDAVKAFEEQGRQTGVVLHAGELPAQRVKADGSKVSQVIYNLVSNAVKYSPSGGTVTVSGSVNGAAAEVQVKDEGLGLTPEQIAQMFAPFMRFHEGVPGVPKGTGLGLYISKGIIEQHGGRLWVQSAGPGKGSTFAFSLPLWSEPSAALEGAKADAAP